MHGLVDHEFAHIRERLLNALLLLLALTLRRRARARWVF
jgi:hypothetical protein